MNDNFVSRSRHSQDTIDKILELKEEGIPSRIIAEQLLGRSTAKSTVNDLWNEYQEHVEFIARAGGEMKVDIYEDDHAEDEVDDTPAWAVDEAQLDHLIDTSTDLDVVAMAKKLRTAQRTNAQLRKIHRKTTDDTTHFEEMVTAVEKATSRIRYGNAKSYVPARLGAQKSTMEVLFSDLQVGKIGQHYNSRIAKKAIKQYGEDILKAVDERKMKYDLERIVFASLGDIVEDHMKHGIQSSVSCDSGLAEQMANAITYMWEYLIQPLAALGIPMDVVGIAGNHGSSQHKGMDMYKAGLYSYDYTIYRALKGYCKAAGYHHVLFEIPEGSFGTTEIYGNTVLYEHGYSNQFTEKGMNDHARKRGNQLKKHVEYFRQGDKHHVVSYDHHKQVINGAFFGLDDQGIEFSGVLGFNSVPSQVVMFHCPELTPGRSTVKEFLTVQLAQR